MGDLLWWGSIPVILICAGRIPMLAPAFAALLLLIWAVRVLCILRGMRRDMLPLPRRRDSNPPLPGRKPAPPAGPPDWRRSFTHECINPPTGEPPLKLRQRKPALPEQPLTAQLIRLWAWLDPAMGEPWPEDCKPPPDVAAAINLRLDRDIAIARRKRGLSPYGWGPRQLNPPPPAPGMRREWLWSPSQVTECGGPCWEAQDPRRCDCGALWRDVPATPTKPQPHGGRQLPNLP